jgi:hypothetical protein
MRSEGRPVPAIRLGNNGPVMGTEGFGCMGMVSGYYGPTDEAESDRVQLRQPLPGSLSSRV